MSPDDGSPNVFIPTGNLLSAYAEAAICRLGYLHADWRIESIEEGIAVTFASDVSPDAVRRELFYALYRERILVETMSMRRDLLALVKGQ